LILTEIGSYTAAELNELDLKVLISAVEG